MIHANPSEAGAPRAPVWNPERSRHKALLVMGGDAFERLAELPADVENFRLQPLLLDARFPVPAEALRGVDIIVVQSDAGDGGALDRIARLVAAADGRPVVVALDGPTLAQLRSYMRLGVADVLPLPLQHGDLAQTLASLSERVRAGKTATPSGRIVTFLKSKGGVGGTTVATQVAAAVARSGGDTALLDFDVQLGCAALYLGLVPQLGMGDVIGAADRIDGTALRAAMTVHPCGLNVLAAPAEALPLDSLSAEAALLIADSVAREYGTVFIDAPLDWTDWSLSLMARSDLLVALTDLSLAGLHNGRRRLELLKQQGLSDVPLKLVVTRVEKRRFRALSFADAERALGRAVDLSVAKDDDVVADALTQGRLLSELYPSARVTRDCNELAAMIQAQLGHAG